MENYLEVNKALWNAKTAYHKDSAFYNMEAFLEGKSSLQEIERKELVPFVEGKSVLHLQCHFGQDTLSLARLGAKATGIDLSPNAIALARQLNDKLHLDAEFVVSDVYDLPNHLDKKFDIVFTSYGVLTWLPDLDKWADVISHFLKPGGLFYIVEFHPTLYMYDHDTKEIAYRYFSHDKPYEEKMVSTYADQEAEINLTEYFWSHPLSKILQSLIDKKLTIKQFNEFDFSPYDCFPNMLEVQKDRFVFGDLKNRLPHVFSIQATSVL